MRLLRLLSRFLALPLILVPALLTALLLLAVATQPGTRLLLQQGADFLPGELRIGEIRGSLAGGLRLRDLAYTHPALRARAQQLDLDLELAQLLRRTVHVAHLEGRGLEITLTPDQEAPEPPPEAAAFPLPDAIPMPVTVDLPRGELHEIRLHPAEGTEPIVLDRLALGLHLDARRLQLRHLDLQAPQGRLHALGRVTLARPYALGLAAEWSLALPPEAARPLRADRARGRLVLDGDLTHLALQHHLQEPMQARTRGHVRHPLTHPDWDLNHRWEAFTLALAEDRSLQLDAGTLVTRGTPGDYRLGLHTALTAAPLPRQALALSARGDPQGLQLTPLSLSGETGQLQVAGRIGWTRGLDWALDLRGRDLDPSALAAELPGRLQLQATTRGRIAPDAPLEARVNLAQLSGTLRERPIRGQGEVRVDDRRLEIPGLNLAAGDNHLEARGRLADTLDLDFRLQAPALETLWPGLVGRLEAEGRVQGTPQAPVLTTRARGSGLELGNLGLKRLDLDLQAGTAVDAPLRLDLGLEDLHTAAGTVLQRLTLEGRGTTGTHRLDLALEGGPAGGNVYGDLALEGALPQGLRGPLHWNGTLTALDLRPPFGGPWGLQERAALHASPSRAGTEPICLMQDKARLCLQGDWSGEGGTRAEARLSQLPLDLLQAWLPPNLGLEGRVDGGARLRLDPGPTPKWNLEAHLTPGDGRLRILDEDGTLQTVPFRDARADLRLQDRDLEASLGLDIATQGHIRARLRGRGREDGDLALEGQARLTLEDLTWMDPLIPQVKDLRGRVQGDLDMGGSLRAPRLDGRLTLSEGVVTLPEAGITLKDMRLDLHNEGRERLRLTGRLRSGEGSLTLEGDVQRADDGPPPVRLQVRGEDFLALRRPDVQAVISPDLNITAIGRRVIVTGDVAVPRALLELAELPPQAVEVSEDEVIVQEAREESGAPLLVVARVGVTLGEEVRIRGYGLDARLGGELQVQQSPGLPTRLLGQIRIQEGRYKAYGQDLTVERGLLLFQGPPENPGLDLRAVRRIPAHEVTVGLEMGGTLEHPRSRVFSDPPMEETEALAFLVTGRPLSGAGEGDGNAIASAIAVYGIERGAFIIDRLGSELGLDEFTVDTETGLDEAALMMGEQLSSRLFLRYSVGLFDRVNTLMLRYSLSPHLSLETRSSSENQSMDLIYRLER
ncbi:autotransporter secretion inner membrane protein TamB [Ectothiorhodospira mobilis]|uniref:Autotransporter secretion inner membrane protein TamB n=1 Tax=Ectothiorhodospira mobilis TaxID=195064 RepID=A0A1I4S567_ECTMO|nr:translocation/assembly module TamB domain-containing protein [Ectothiorhodospira mobilis]SFM59647.1 autotransporter secretion inner membrane protein TamB [Ectothiorhodospira mobilis]